MTSDSVKPPALDQVKRAVIAGYPIIGINSWEEDRTIDSLLALSKAVYAKDQPVYVWDIQAGLYQDESIVSGGQSLSSALEKVQDIDEQGFFIFKDSFSFLDDPAIQRRIRKIYQAFRGQGRFLFLIGVEARIPLELQKEVFLVDFGFPSPDELRDILDRAISAANRKGVEGELSEEQLEQAAVALKGFTIAEAHHSLNKILRLRKTLDEGFLRELQNEKEQIARKEGILEYVKTINRLDEVGGLENLKNWLQKRKKLFSPQAAAAGIRPPRGLLMMGISGCGKSLSVKAISSLWHLPLFRLDMNRVYSGIFGSPEAAFQRAIQSIEAVAPAILWIDEIEGGISNVAMKDGGTGSHIFSAFLTWMQEKTADVFVAATANRIDLLPAEVIRKGRFDQIFFIDLPNDHEREAIFRVHLKMRGYDPGVFDLPLLSVATEFWNGAEIEHVVEAAIIEAFHRGEKMTQDDIYTIIRATVPLARTMAEQIKFIKTWASERAVSASKTDPE